jgi:hypothetical protein
MQSSTKFAKSISSGGRLSPGAQQVENEHNVPCLTTPQRFILRYALVTTCAILSSLLIEGCGNPETDEIESRRSAVTQYYYGTNLVIPAYFTDSTQWSTLLSSLGTTHAGAVVIVSGSNNGPDSPVNQTLASRIGQLRSQGAKIIGYVNYATSHVYALLNEPDMSQSPSAIAQQIHTWIEGYHTDGVFFDLAWRRDQDVNDGDLSNAEGLSELASNLIQAQRGDWTGAITMFNWSVPYPQMRRYVDCLIIASWWPPYALFVSQETSETLYGQEDSTWSWIYNYKPLHFAHIINGVASSSSVPPYDARARQRNAAYYIFTERAMDYNALPQASMWNADLTAAGIGYNDYGGIDNDNLASYSCPAYVRFP